MMLQSVSRASFNPGARFIILFVNPNVKSTMEAQEIFAYDLFRLMYDRFNAARVIFLHAVNADEYNIFVTHPYTNTEECGKIDVSEKLLNDIQKIYFFFQILK